VPLFDDAILANSALDRLAHNAHQVVIDGESYRATQQPGKGKKAPARRRKS
jgi:DNA replication protein DnaC